MRVIQLLILLSLTYQSVCFDAKNFLSTFGYYNPASFNGADDFTEAILAYQRFFGLPQTGIVDAVTKAEMKKPRCGNSDHTPSNKNAYFKTGRKWSKVDLTYRIINRTPDLSSKDVDETIQKAFDVWANVTNLSFAKTSGYSHLTVGFYSRGHLDSNPFDGPEGVLAHAYFPTDGRVHFDEDETWVINGRKGADLLMVAVHEIGHALGLHHSQVRGSIMWPTYAGYKPNLQLHVDDITGIQSLYGLKGDGGDCTNASASCTHYKKALCRKNTWLMKKCKKYCDLC